jgi:hypothetical protein
MDPTDLKIKIRDLEMSGMGSMQLSLVVTHSCNFCDTWRKYGKQSTAT